MIFYFSGTGNSAWVARRLAEGRLCADKQGNAKADACMSVGQHSSFEDVVSIAEALRRSKVYSLAPQETLGFVFPVYAWGPPPVVLRFVEQLQLASSPAYVYFVCTCGDDTGRTAQVFSAALQRKGWTCAGGWSVTMPNTYVSLPGFDVDVPEVEEQKVRHAEARLQFIANELARRVQMGTFNCHEGAAPLTKTYVLRPLFHSFLMSSRPFHVTGSCVGCGKCERACPMQNIHLSDGRPVWGSDCAHCLACYHACPVHAVAYGPWTRSKGQYRRFL